MTRDEARAKIAAATNAAPDYPMVDFFLTAASALGLFTPAEPETVEDRASKIISQIAISDGKHPAIRLTDHNARFIFVKLRKAGIELKEID